MKSSVRFSAAAPLLGGLLLFAGILFHADTAVAYAKQGLFLCGNLILPSLFPFFVLTFLLNDLGLPGYLGRFAEPLMQKLFGISGTGAAAFLTGITGGYPLGAGCIADLVQKGELAPDEGDRLLLFCNNSGPAFLIGAVGVGIFHSGGVGLLLYAVHVFSALVTGLFLSGRNKIFGCRSRSVLIAPLSLSQSLPDAVQRSALQMLTICGFVVTFNVLIGLLDSSGVFSFLYGLLAQYTGYELRLTRALCTGILELGCGIGTLAGAARTPANLAVCGFLTGFGGISVAMQTAAVLAGTKIKISRHFVGRFSSGCIAAFTLYVLALLMGWR